MEDEKNRTNIVTFITSPNRIVNACAPVGRFGAPKNCSRLRLCAILSPPKIFVPVKCCRIFLIGHKNPSFTTGTLYAVPLL